MPSPMPSRSIAADSFWAIKIYMLPGIKIGMKITVIGTGRLGGTIAYSIANRDITDELVLVDYIEELAEGQKTDLKHATAFRDIEISSNYENAKNSDIIVVTAGKPRTKDTKSRLELMETNAKIVSSVAENISKLAPKSIIITLSNPVDVMNYVIHKKTGFDRNRVIGSGGMLDSQRLKTVMAQEYGVKANEIEAYVIGEHGDKQVPVFSRAKMAGKRVKTPQREKILQHIKQSGANVIGKKGATEFGPANGTADMIEAIVTDAKSVMPCSVVLEGEYGFSDMSIGIPALLGRKGILGIEEWELDEWEKRRFAEGCEKLKGCCERLSGI